MAQEFDPAMHQQWLHALQQEMNEQREWRHHQEQLQQQQQQPPQQPHFQGQQQPPHHADPGGGLRVQIKLPPPEKFSGGPSSISPSQWIAAMEHYLSLTRVVLDGEQIVAAAGFLQQSALAWWLQNKEQLRVGTWDEFKEAFLRYFQPVNAADTARARLFGLRQQPGFNGYNIYRDRFHRLITEIPNMSEEEKLGHFKNGLLPETKKFVLLQRPKTCHEAMEMGGLVEEASRSANPNSNFRNLGRGPPNRPQGRGNPPFGANSSATAFRAVAAPPASQGPAPMELGKHLTPEYAVMNGPPPSQSPNYLCFLCGGRGHGVARCPQLNQARRLLGKPPLRMQPRPNFTRPQFQTQVVEDEAGSSLEYNEGEYWEVEELPFDYEEPTEPGESATAEENDIT